MLALSFDGQPLTEAAGYDCWVQPAERRATVQTESRGGGAPPTRIDHTVEPVEIPFEVACPTGFSLATFVSQVGRLFRVDAGQRSLVVQHPDGTSIALDVDVTSLRQTSVAVFQGTFLATDTAWRAVAGSSSSSNPVAIAGERVRPLISLSDETVTATLAYRRVSITDVTGEGLQNEPIRITFDSTGYGATTTADYLAVFSGLAVPFYLQNPNNGSTTIDLAVDVPPSGTVYVDLWYGSDVNNTITAQSFQASGLHLTNADYSASARRWNDLRVNRHIAASGRWRPAKTGKSLQGVSYGITFENQYNLTISLRPDDSLKSDVDGIVLVIGSKAGLTSALTGVQRILTETAGTARVFCRYRVAGQAEWSNASEFSLSGGYPRTNVTTTNPTNLNGGINDSVTTVTVNSAAGIPAGRTIRVDSEYMYVISKAGNDLSVVRATDGSTAASHINGAAVNLVDAQSDIDLDSAVEIAIGIEPIDTDASANLGISGILTTVAYGLALSANPTISVGAAQAAWRLDGDLVNVRNNHAITFDEVYLTSMLLVDAEYEEFRTPGDAPWFRQGISFSHPQDWLAFEPGNNGWLAPSGASVAYSWRERYAA